MDDAAGASNNEDVTRNQSPSPAQTVADIARSIQQPVMPATPPGLQPSISGPTPGAPAPMKATATPATFDDVYSLAEIKPPVHGFTIFKIAQMLESQHIRSLPVEVKRSSVLLALEAAGVKLEEIIQDAVRRDKALDAYESVQQRAVDQIEAQIGEKNRKLQEEMDRNNAEIRQRRDAFETWRRAKQIEEQRIAAAVGPFVSENPITTTQSAAQTKEAKNV
jgi:C4-dicarboxylate-specific signal transduction histidine kinase